VSSGGAPLKFPGRVGEAAVACAGCYAEVDGAVMVGASTTGAAVARAR
jgi:isoaspartyl peptidase/L-asparaginase-like protein (Ntn-hydrolase superfamily)